MATSNIDRFDECAALIFARLYTTFPIPVKLSDFEVIPKAWKDDEFVLEVYQKESEFVTATILWLRDAGYISGQVISLGLIDAVLTSKGLEVMKATPSSISGGPSLGDRLTDAVKEGGKETMRRLVSEALGIGARLISPLVGLSS